MENQNMGMGQQYPTCKCMHHSMMPWGVMLIGILVLVQAFNLFSMRVAMVILGVLLIFIGGTKMNAHRCNCCGKDKIH